MGVRVCNSVGGLAGLVDGIAGLVAGLTGLVSGLARLVVVTRLLVRLVDRAIVVTTGLVASVGLVGAAGGPVGAVASTGASARILEFFQLVVECQIGAFGHLIVGIVHELSEFTEQSVHVEVEVVGVGVEVVG